MRDIITNLFKEYGQVEYQDLVENRSNLSEPWDANRPLQELVQHVKEIQEFANDGGRKISNKNIVENIYTLVYNTGLFYYNCEKWDDRQHDEKTWAKLQAHFQAAQRKFKRKQKVSTRADGYHGTNYLREMGGTYDALINLATEAASDRETMMSKCKTMPTSPKTFQP